MSCPLTPDLGASVGLPYEAGIPGVEEASIATARHRANLIFLSYRYSQGGIGSQNRMLLYIEENFDPELMQGPQVDTVQDLSHRVIGRYFLNQKLHPATAIPWEDDSPEAAIKTDTLVTNELAGLFDRFNAREEIATFTSDIGGIAQSVIVMDADYLRRPGGRAGDSEELKIVVDPYTRDPYDSLFIKHAVLGTGTNTVEFDEIFSKLATSETLQGFDVYTLRQLQFVLKTYLERHAEASRDVRLIQVSTRVQGLLDGK